MFMSQLVITQRYLSYQTKLIISGEKKDDEQIFDTTMFLKSLPLALITRAF